MRLFAYVLAVFFLSLTTQSKATLLKYNFEHIASKCILIKVDFIGSEKGITKLYIPNKIWGTNFRSSINHLQLHKSSQYFSDSLKSSITHAPYENVLLSYTLCPKLIQGNNFFTYLDVNKFYFFPKNVLVMPYTNLKEIIYKNDKHIHKIKLDEERKSTENFVYLGRKKRLSLKFNNTLFIEDGLEVSQLKLVKLINKILISQKQLFYNVNPKPLSIWILKKSDNYNIEGIKIHNNLVIRISNNDINEIIEVIAHELMHRWFGELIPLPSDNSHKWFFEGFTEYYAQKSLLKARIIDQVCFLDKYKQVLLEYFSSYACSASDEIISRHYWHNDSLRRIAYLRGQIIAYELDSYLKDKTNQEKCLEDLIYIILSQTTDQKANFNLDLFIASICQLIGSNYNSFIQNTVNGTLKITDLQSPYNSLNIKIPNYGFDILNSFLNKKILGVKKGNIAWNSGLRNGQRLLGFYVQNSYIEINVEVDKNVKTIRFHI